ncbi:MAG: prolipoprotein diacylglyceryl transferase [Actinobacteria bacterium]|nr:prolipoprotein diacylglyceryl transferase [Actinomycetota bacterium]MBU1944664.1 prolipoprotein diacylglyceryl transferase [Actinomycetota bacterium]MBU2689212.1 prolipoprotein diacylglyceryl transferase [Actinomycetota bacterium]
MHRELLQIGGLTIYSYGVFLAIGFITATVVARQRFKEIYRDPDIILDFVLAAVVGGIIGARLFYVIGHWSEFAAHPGEILKFNMDGLVFYGGLVLGLALTIAVARWKHVRFWVTMDLAGLCVPLALAIGRVGCFLNGCCYGKETSLFWGVHYPVSLGLTGARHPTQLYELVLDLTLFGLLWWKRDAFARDGTLFWAFVMGYGAIRFTVEIFREHAQANAGLGFQAASLAMVAVAGLVLLFRYRVLPARGSERLQ